MQRTCGQPLLLSKQSEPNKQGYSLKKFSWAQTGARYRRGGSAALACLAIAAMLPGCGGGVAVNQSSSSSSSSSTTTSSGSGGSSSGSSSSGSSSSTSTSVAATPVITFSTATCPAQVVISDATPGTTIYYTADGTTPTTSSTAYSTPIAVDATQSGTINAIAVANGYTQSVPGSLSYAAAPAPPTFFPAGGPYTVEPGNVQVNSAVSGTTIFYTTDGSTPTTSSASYSGAIAVSPAAGSSQTIKAIAVNGGTPSCAASASYTYIPPSSAQSIAQVSINPSAAGAAIPGDFAGLSLDHNEVARWVGPPAKCGGSGQLSCAPNGAYQQLLSNLISASGNSLFLRIEGDGAMAPDNSQGPYYNNCQHAGNAEDYAQVSVAGDPLGFSLLGPVKSLLTNLNVKVSLGIDMACNQASWASNEASNYRDETLGLGSTLWSKVAAIELGNEPDNYIYQGFRCTGYTFSGMCSSQSYLQDWQQWTGNVVAALGSSNVKFMGPSTAGSSYNAGVQAALGKDFTAAIVSQHNYAFGVQPICTSSQISAGTTSGCNLPDQLLQASAVYGPKTGPNLYKKYLDAVHTTAPGTTFRIGEFNDVGRGGEPGLSDTFQSALWLLDEEFYYASLGYDGTNLHTGQYTAYGLFQFTSNYGLQMVRPKYYGLLMFEMAAGHGAHLLPVTTSTGANLTAWATVDSSDVMHVVIINKDESATGTVTINAPGYNTGVGQLLTAPSYVSACMSGAGQMGCSAGVNFDGKTFDGSTDGRLVNWTVGHGSSCPLTPESLCEQKVTASGDGAFTVTMPITSAMLLDLRR